MLKSRIPIIFCFPRGYRGLHFSRFSPWISTAPLNSVLIHGSTIFPPVDIHGPSFFSLRGYPRFQKNFRPPYHDNNFHTLDDITDGIKRWAPGISRTDKTVGAVDIADGQNRGTVDTYGPPGERSERRPVRIHGAPVFSSAISTAPPFFPSAISTVPPFFTSEISFRVW